MSLRVHVILKLLVVLVATSVLVDSAEAGKITYYIQLIRGTAENKPPSTDAKPVGPKISKELSLVFKWSHYWEMTRQEVTIERGKKTSIQLNPQRAVEIDLSKSNERKVTAFEGKKPVSTIINPIGSTMTIIGGDRTANSSWFIVVRRDKPSK